MHIRGFLKSLGGSLHLESFLTVSKLNDFTIGMNLAANPAAHYLFGLGPLVEL